MGRHKKIQDPEEVGVFIVDTIIDELFPLVKNAIADVTRQTTMSGRIGYMTEIMRKAIVKSSLGMYNGRAYIFTGKIYEPLRTEDFRNAIYEVMRMCNLGYNVLNKYWMVANAALELVRSKELFIDQNSVAFENGVLDLETAEFSEHSKDHVQISMMHFSYDPLAECPRWDKFLDQVLPLKSKQMIIQEFLGSIYIDRKQTKMEQMLILKGSGSNGKGVIFETITGILGKENVTNFGLDSLLTGVDQKKNIAMINGKKLNYCSEIQALTSGKFTDRLKTLISGEPTEARALYGENFMAQDIPLLIANCNKLPKLEDSSYGMQRRVIIIPFNKTIPLELQDNALSVKLAKEYSGIFNWLLEGRARFIKRGFKFTKCEEVRQSIEEFTASNSQVVRFMMAKEYYPMFESIADIKPARILVTDLYNQYLLWCKEAKEKKPKTLLLFSKELSEAGYSKTKVMKGTVFNVYGEAATKLVEAQERELDKFYSSTGARSHRPYFEDGVMYGKGDWNAAFYAHVSRSWLSTMRIKGKLEGCYTYQGSTPVYNIDALCKRVDKLGAFIDHEHKILALAQKEEERMEAVSFNESMSALGLPFRKWIHGMISHNDRNIYVPNEWEYSEEAAAVAVKEHAEQQLLNIK